MTKEEWNEWFPKFWSTLNERQRFELNQSEEFQEAIDREDYWSAQDVIFELFEDSN